MAKINFTKKAKIDLEEIWEYTYETWSEKQADKYYNELIEKCQELKKDSEQGRDYSILFLSLKGYKVNKHIIFYRLLDKGKTMEIARILHEKMYLKKHLKD
ncbi:MAG: type II toxin-antitoxin system RelE/ParE family toxin [Saprospiraceae bacterium]